MRIKDDGGPAFPVWELNGDGQAEMTCFGMSLRDYFAAKILPEATRMYMEYANDHGVDEQWRMGVALDCYMMADAMLEARKK